MERIDRFELRGRLGEGGMASVWRAWDPRLGREVALKLLRPGARRAERLLVEARAAAGLVHPGVVRVHEVGEHQGAPYLVMDLIEGETLGARLEREGRLPVRSAVDLVAGLAEALAAAHARGIAHRDLKPENVLLPRAGGALLADFGLAQLGEEERAERLTRTGELVGTPAYMAPEQVTADRGQQGPPCDVHALGVLLHELLTGRRPWEEDSFAQLAAAIVGRAATPPSHLRPEVDPALDAVCLACLAKQPEARPGADQVARALRAWLAGRSPRDARAPRLAAGLVLLGGAALAAAVLAVRAPLEEPTPAVAPPSLVAAPTTLEPPRPAPASIPADWPAWFADRPAGERPPLPLPGPLRPGREPGQYDWPLPDDQLLPLVWIPPGSGPDGAAVAGFFLAAREVSWQEWAGFVRDTGAEVWNVEDMQSVQDRRALFERRPELPALPTWREARDWCEWAGLRLPTLAEWRRAAALEGADRETAPLQELRPAGQGPPGGAGCLHLTDNVLEWVQDPLGAHPELDVNRLVAGDPQPDERLLCGGSYLRGPGRDASAALGEDRYAPDGGLRPALRRARPRTDWRLEAHAFVPVEAERSPSPGPLRAYDLLRAASQRRLDLRLPRLDLSLGQSGFFDPQTGRGPTEAAGFPADYFAVEATTLIELAPGRWRLRVDADDGVRVWLGRELVFDLWEYGVHWGLVHELELGTPRALQVRVEHVELEGDATLRVRLEPVE